MNELTIALIIIVCAFVLLILSIPLFATLVGFKDSTNIGRNTNIIKSLVISASIVLIISIVISITLIAKSA